MWLTRISIQHPVFASMMMLALMVLGIASWQKVGVEEFPTSNFRLWWCTPTIPVRHPKSSNQM